MTTTDTGPLRPPAMLITGAAHRIGRHLALYFARKGWAIGVHYNSSRGPAEELVRDIEIGGGRATALGANLQVHEDVVGLVPACAEALGPLSCLINNASTFDHDDIETLTSDGWDNQLATNLKAPVFLAQAFAAQVPDGGELGGLNQTPSDPGAAAAHSDTGAATPSFCRGNIVNIVDQRVWNLDPQFFSYMISKAGLWTATQTLAQALAPRIRVNAIAPGPVLRSVHQAPEEFASERISTPLKRGTSPEEIAQAIAFILDAPAMTGQMIALDGGQHLSWQA